MGILKKRGRPSKAEEIAKKEQEEAENISAKKKELEILRERLKGKTVIYKREDLNITFTIESVTFLYDGVCLSDGKPDGYSLALLREELGQLLRYGVFAKDKRDGEKVTSEIFILAEEDGQLAKQEETEMMDLEERPIPEAEPQEQEPVLLNPAFSGQPGEQEKKEEEAKGSDIILDCIHETSEAFQRMVEHLGNNGCAPGLVIRVYNGKERHLENLYEMMHWYNRKEGNA